MAKKLMTIEEVINDLENYLRNLGIVLSTGAKCVFLEVENISDSIPINNPPQNETFVLAFIRAIPKFGQMINFFGGNSLAAERELFEDLAENRDKNDNYPGDDTSYSIVEHRNLTSRTIILDLAIKNAKSNYRNEILEVDIIESLLTYHDELYPVWDNGNWTDESLHVPFTTLAHITGSVRKNLWVKFEDIRGFLGINPGTTIEKLISSAPMRVHESLRYFLTDNPQYSKNCFLIMSFLKTRFHDEIYKELWMALRQYGFNLLRADDRVYSDDLLTNIETYIYGCGFAVAVFERIKENIHNPNVSFEVGYLNGLNKPVCYLKEKTLPKLPSDLIGKLYVEFSLEDVHNSMHLSMKKWLVDKRLL